MSKKQTEPIQEPIEAQEEKRTLGQWINDNANLLEWIALIIVIIALACVLVNNYWLRPKHTEASNENAKSVVYFQAGDWEKALHGDDAECIGFEQTAKDYSMLQEGELAALYAGICYYQLGDYEQAAHYLSKFDASDVNIDPAAHQLLGDAYVQMGDYAKAINAYKHAIASGNEVIAPMSLKKMGLVELERGNKAAARKAFEQIKRDYPASTEAQDIDRYIAQ